MKKEKQLSPIFCEHANECPAICNCPDNCYCKSHTCKPRNDLIGVRDKESENPKNILAKDLRIGNLLYWDNDKVYAVAAIHDDVVDFEYNKDYPEWHPENVAIHKINPIVLTEDWLIKAGFEVYFENEMVAVINNWHVFIKNENGNWRYKVNPIQSQWIEYVHQLKLDICLNLYRTIF